MPVNESTLSSGVYGPRIHTLSQGNPACSARTSRVPGPFSTVAAIDLLTRPSLPHAETRDARASARRAPWHDGSHPSRPRGRRHRSAPSVAADRNNTLPSMIKGQSPTPSATASRCSLGVASLLVFQVTPTSCHDDSADAARIESAPACSACRQAAGRRRAPQPARTAFPGAYCVSRDQSRARSVSRPSSRRRSASSSHRAIVSSLLP